MEMRRSLSFVHLIFIAGFFVLAVATGTEAGCTKDVDCKGNRICEKGICVDPKPAQLPPEGIITPDQKKKNDWLTRLDGARFVRLIQLNPPYVSWTGPSGPFVTQMKVVFIVKGNAVWRQDLDLAANGQILHASPEMGPYRIEARQFAPGDKLATISEGGTFITLGDGVWQRE
jgi:hypothetical protein